MHQISNARASLTAPEAASGLKGFGRWWLATHITLSLTGFAALALVAVACLLWQQPQWRQNLEDQALTWLLNRQEDPTVAATPLEGEPDAADRVNVASLAQLPKSQAAVTLWLSRRYRVAAEPLGVLVAEAFDIGRKLKLDPTLILAVMAIESRFNPYAQSPVGAQGLMQVLTRVHTDKYENFGGETAAFDPVSNLRVGAQVLYDAVRKAGSVEGGLRLYVGAVSSDGSDYINKVMAEHLRLQSVAQGLPMPKEFPVYAPAPASLGASALPAGTPSPQPLTAPKGDTALEAEAPRTAPSPLSAFPVSPS